MKFLLLLFSLSCYMQAQLPNLKLTPGAVRTTDAKEICSPSFHTNTVRHTSQRLKKQVCREYGLVHCPLLHIMEIDHLIPLELGGADTLANLWPELATYPSGPGFHEKDKVENYLHRQVCNGNIPLVDAQKGIATDWQKYLATAHRSLSAHRAYVRRKKRDN